MQARLFVSSALLLCSFAKSSFACGPNAPVPEVSIKPLEGKFQIDIHGNPANFIFEYLSGPDARKTVYPGFQIRRGQGIVCVGSPAIQYYACRETVSGRGLVNDIFPGTEPMTKTQDWLILNLNGPSLEQLYTSFGKGGDAREDGTTIEYIKIGEDLTCSKIQDLETGASTFSCSQYLSRDGYPIGTGTDPLIGSGTHPVVDANEGGNQ